MLEGRQLVAMKLGVAREPIKVPFAGLLDGLRAGDDQQEGRQGRQASPFAGQSELAL